MVTPDQLIEKTNTYLRERGDGPLRSPEIVYITKKWADILSSRKAKCIEELEMMLALCIAKCVCQFRGYRVPEEVKNWLD